MVNHYSFKINSNTYKIKCESKIEYPIEEDFYGEINIPAFNNFPKNVIKFHAQMINELNVQISFKNEKLLYIKTEKIGDWKEFLNSHFLNVIGLLATFIVESEGENILWIEPFGSELVWVMGILSDSEYSKGMLVKRKIPELSPDYFFSGIHNRHALAKVILKYFKSWLGTDFPFCSDFSDSRRYYFTVKVNPETTWFLLFPLSHFCQFKYGYFKYCKEPEWIVTNRSFIQNTCDRIQLQNELCNIENILQHSVIILNTYSHWETKVVEKAQKGIDLIREVFSFFKDIYFQSDNPISLRWYINPTSNEILNELVNQEVRYFFADFHVNNGTWQIGEGQKFSWLSTSMVDQQYSDQKREIELFNLNRKWDLSHKRLMRVFHCESVFDVYINGSEPADAHSIVRLFLNCGAQRVEGGMTTESFFDYLCSLFDLLCRDKGLGPLLVGKCLETGFNHEFLIHRINKFLSSCDWDTI